MISSIVSRLVILVFGTLYPAYASYKAVRTKDLREYIKWMMYWIVFALFTCAETFTDVFLSFWFPFYYELKVIVVLWLLSPATRGSSILYRKFVHPTLTKREKEIDEAIMHAKAQGYSTILRLGARGVDYAKYVIMQTAMKGLQNTAQLQPLQSLTADGSSITVADGPGTSTNANGHFALHSNGLINTANVDHLGAFQYSALDSNGFTANVEHLDAFQYSDDDDADYIPPPVTKEEVMEPEYEPTEDQPATRTRPKRRSARSKKQTKPVHYDDYDFED